MNLELFIENIRKHPELYDKKNKNYMNINEKQKVWKELDKIYQIDAKKKWNSLRDKYVREKKKLEAPSGSAAKEINMWELFPLLTFLNESLKPRRMKENMSSESTGTFTAVEDDNSESWTFEADYLSESGMSTSAVNFDVDTQDSCLPASSTPRPTRKRRHEAEDQINKAFLETVSVFSEKLKETTDDNEDSLFLKSIEKKMKKMSEEEKCKFKIEILIKATEAVKNSNDV